VVFVGEEAGGEVVAAVAVMFEWIWRVYIAYVKHFWELV
jgi:hypothetical protein